MTTVNEMNDRSPTTRSTRPPICSTVAWRTLQRSRFVDPGIGSQAFVQLAVTDVEGHDVGCAALQQTVGEPAGRRAGVEGAHAVHVDGEHVERMIELLGATADEPSGWPGDDARRRRLPPAATPCRRPIR